jgi:hypothetical protein
MTFLSDAQELRSQVVRVCAGLVLVPSLCAALPLDDPGCHVFFEPVAPPSGTNASNVSGAAIDMIRSDASELALLQTQHEFNVALPTGRTARARVHGGLCKFPVNDTSVLQGRLVGRISGSLSGLFGLADLDTRAFIWIDGVPSQGQYRIVVIGDPSSQRRTLSATLTASPTCSVSAPLCIVTSANRGPQLVIGPVKDGRFFVADFP